MRFPPPLSERLRQTFGETADPHILLEPGPANEDLANLDARLSELASRASVSSRYRVIEEIARGGMGTILKVWDNDFHRPLAMKVMQKRGDEGDREDAALEVQKAHRFLTEAQITGQIDHHGVVPVHELGLDAAGRVYFTMRLVKGYDLGVAFDLARRAEDGWSLARALEVLIKVCDTVAYAHAKGVIHRDLKPANVMVGRFGQVYVVDWGLAKILGQKDDRDLRPRLALDDAGKETAPAQLDARDVVSSPDSPLLTMDGSVIGTPSYMPPEQAQGRIDELGPRSDVYSVGAMLYLLLTGQTPYVKPGARVTPRAVLIGVRNGPPTPILEIDPAAPPELVAICDQAMARSTADRYPDLTAMAEDLRAYRDNRVVRVYSTGPVAEATKWLARNRALAAGIAACLAVAAAAWIGISRFESRAVEAEHSRYVARIAAAEACLRADDTDHALEHLEDCARAHRGWEWRHLRSRAADRTAYIRLDGHERGVHSIAFSPAGEHVAAGAGDGSVSLWDLASRRAIRVFRGHAARVIAVEFPAGLEHDIPDRGRLSSVAEDGSVRIWDTASGDCLATFQASARAAVTAALSPDGLRLAVGKETGALEVLDAATREALLRLEGHRAPVSCVTFSRDGERIASGSSDGSVLIWESSGSSQP